MTPSPPSSAVGRSRLDRGRKTPPRQASLFGDVADCPAAKAEGARAAGDTHATSLDDGETLCGQLVEVVIDKPARSLDRAFTYRVPEHLAGSVGIGSFVLVPFGKERVPGYVIGLVHEMPEFKLRDVISLLLDEPLFSESEVALARRLAEDCFCSLSDAIRCFLPPGSARRPRRMLRTATSPPATEGDGGRRTASYPPTPLPCREGGDGERRTATSPPRPPLAATSLSTSGEGENGERSLAGETPAPRGGRGQGNGAADLDPLARRAPKQAAVLRGIIDSGGECEYDALCRLVGRDGTPAAVTALIAKGLIEESRSLQRPAARERSIRVVGLVEAEVDWEEELEALQSRAPRQGEIIETLLEADGEDVPAAGLNAAAIQALAHRGFVSVSTRRVERRPQDGDGLRPHEPETVTLNPAQDDILRRVQDALQARRHERLLIHGITGSGKTEVYLHSIEAARRLGRGAIVLVPEISLTPQMVGRFRARFGDRLALLHSALGPGERFDEWERIRRGDADIVVGARSAVFAPVRDIGVIVIDEEHDRAYKQESPPRYDARDVAAHRAETSGAVLMLGSATPALETYHRAVETVGDLQLVGLPRRIDDRPLPEITLIDLRNEPPSDRGSHLSDELVEALSQRIEGGEQSILFLNRRGFSTFVMCRECGHSLRCPDCAVSLTYHHKTKLLRCHHCDFARRVPDTCDACGSREVGFHGVGTERVADQIERMFPRAAIARMDRDTVAHKGAHGDIIRRFQSGEANVLIGTQMIAKGLHFPNVTLVGVLNADTGLNRPDFRAAEQTFQLLTQVAGRAGRADKPGNVLIQTYNPDHYAIAAAAAHDFAGFYAHELETRREALYPPFVHLTNVVFADVDEQTALHTAKKMEAILRGQGLSGGSCLPQFLGPTEAPLHKLRGKYRYHLVVKAESAEETRAVLTEALHSLGDTRTTTVAVEIDPVDMM